MSCNWNCKIVGSKSRQLIFYEHKTYLAQYDWVHLLVQKMILKKRNSMKGLVRVRRPNNVEWIYKVTILESRINLGVRLLFFPGATFLLKLATFINLSFFYLFL
jgi:hypothetical protein